MKVDLSPDCQYREMDHCGIINKLIEGFENFFGVAEEGVIGFDV